MRLREIRESLEICISRTSRISSTARNSRILRDSRDSRESRESRETCELRDSRIARDSVHVIRVDPPPFTSIHVDSRRFMRFASIHAIHVNSRESLVACESCDSTYLT